MWYQLLLVVLAIAGPSWSTLVDYGRAERGVFVWIGGDTLPSRLQFVGDPAHGQIYAVDAAGQRYPLFYDEPRTLDIDTVLVNRVAPGLLDPASSLDRGHALEHLIALNDSLIAFGQTPEAIAVVLQNYLQGYPAIERVEVSGNIVQYFWTGWALASSFTAGRRLLVPSIASQYQSYIKDIMTHLQNGKMVLMGYNGMYSIVDSSQVGLYQAEIERIRHGQQPESKLITNKLISDAIKLCRPMTEWLKRAKGGE